jgi:hypothetical protein
MTDFALWRKAIFGNAAAPGRLEADRVEPPAGALDPEADPEGAVALLAQTFTAAGSLAADYTPAQVASGLWFLFDPSCSSYGIALGDGRVSAAARARAIAAMQPLFMDLFAPVLGTGRVPADDGSVQAPLALLCRAFWDVLPLGPQRAAELNSTDACLEVMRHALMMPNLMCVDSAVTGLDLWAGTPANHERIRPILQAFAVTPNPDPEALRVVQALLASLR